MEMESLIARYSREVWNTPGLPEYRKGSVTYKLALMHENSAVGRNVIVYKHDNGTFYECRAEYSKVKSAYVYDVAGQQITAREFRTLSQRKAYRDQVAKTKDTRVSPKESVIDVIDLLVQREGLSFKTTKTVLTSLTGLSMGVLNGVLAELQREGHLTVSSTTRGTWVTVIA